MRLAHALLFATAAAASSSFTVTSLDKSVEVVVDASTGYITQVVTGKAAFPASNVGSGLEGCTSSGPAQVQDQPGSGSVLVTRPLTCANGYDVAQLDLWSPMAQRCAGRTSVRPG
jgi:hypothetical protein